jgi:putative transposase
MLANGRAKILFATVSHHAGRWWVSLNVEAADLHPAHRHPARDPGDGGGWVGVDRGLSTLLVAARVDGTEVARVDDAPKALAAGMKQQRRLAKSLSRKQKGSHNRRDAAAKLGRHHHHVANIRRHFLHQVSNALAKTHDRIVIENLNVSGMLTNHRLARAISDAGWAKLARMLGYKQGWRGGELFEADRWYPSSKLCPAMRCHQRRSDAGGSAVHLRLRIFRGPRPECCGQSRPLGPGPPRNLTRSPDPQARRPGHQRPPTGRR